MPERLRDTNLPSSDTPLQWVRIRLPVLLDADAEYVTQDRLALSLGVAGTSLSNWERGFSSPGPSKRTKYAQLLGITRRDLHLMIVATRTMGLAHFAATELLKTLGININRIDVPKMLETVLVQQQERLAAAPKADQEAITVLIGEIEAAIKAIKDANDLADTTIADFQKRYFAAHPEKKSA